VTEINKDWRFYHAPVRNPDGSEMEYDEVVPDPEPGAAGKTQEARDAAEAERQEIEAKRKAVASGRESENSQLTTDKVANDKREQASASGRAANKATESKAKQ